MDEGSTAYSHGAIMSVTIPNIATPPSAIPIPAAVDPLRTARPFLDQVLATTREIYAGIDSVEEREDWEIAGDWTFVISVVDRGDLDAILERHDQWHRRLVTFSPDARIKFQLSIDIQT